MVDAEEVLDCMLTVDEILSEVEDAMEQKEYSKAFKKVKSARALIDEMREDDETEDDRQEVEMHMDKQLAGKK